MDNACLGFPKELQALTHMHDNAIRLYARQGFKRSFLSKL